MNKGIFVVYSIFGWVLCMYIYLFIVNYGISKLEEIVIVRNIVFFFMSVLGVKNC